MLVVNADTIIPGRGFFWLAREHLGAHPVDASNDEVFIQETKRVYEHYRKHPSGWRTGRQYSSREAGRGQ